MDVDLLIHYFNKKIESNVQTVVWLMNLQNELHILPEDERRLDLLRYEIWEWQDIIKVLKRTRRRYC